MAAVVHFTVRGSGNFPFDMLSRCQCWPATWLDAERISLACPTQAPPQEITFITHTLPSGQLCALWREKKWPLISGLGLTGS